MVSIILESENTNQEKANLLVQLQEKLLFEKDIEIEIEKARCNFEKARLEIELENQKKHETEQLELLEEKNRKLFKEKEENLVYKLYVMQRLTLRAVIEKYEENFDSALLEKNVSRESKWKEFLSNSYEMFQPFEAAGFTVEQVSSIVDTIYNSDCADIPFEKVVNGFALKTGDLFNKDQRDI